MAEPAGADEQPAKVIDAADAADAADVADVADVADLAQVGAPEAVGTEAPRQLAAEAADDQEVEEAAPDRGAQLVGAAPQAAVDAAPVAVPLPEFAGPPCIEVQRTGPMVSVQDTGRLGQRAFGVARSGAMDVMSLVLANLLVGNPRDAAGLEITMPNLRLRFNRATRIALTGADVDARLDGTLLLPWWSYAVAAGAELTIRPPSLRGAVGLHTYLAVAGGIDVEPVLGSRSTDLKAGFGGFQGRPLANGDRLPLRRAATAPGVAAKSAPPFGIRSPAFFWPRLLGTDAVAAIEVRFLPGPEWEDFSMVSRRLLSSETWAVSPRSNRIGYRLSGPTLVRLKARDRDLLSHGVLPGVIQVPPDGQPIVLLADAQTTGGYPKIGAVISADIAVMAQVRPGARVRFVPCEAGAARQALQDVEIYLAQMSDVIADRLNRPGA